MKYTVVGIYPINAGACPHDASFVDVIEADTVEQAATNVCLHRGADQVAILAVFNGEHTDQYFGG